MLLGRRLLFFRLQAGYGARYGLSHLPYVRDKDVELPGAFNERFILRLSGPVRPPIYCRVGGHVFDAEEAPERLYDQPPQPTGLAFN